MKKIITKALQQANDDSSCLRTERVYGGSINQSFYIETNNKSYFLKYHPEAPDHFFEREAEGLARIKETNSVSVPEVFAVSNEESASFLLLEWIEGEATSRTEFGLGQQIARMHHVFAAKHGYKKMTYIGTLPQSNGLFSNWLYYYRDERLLTQVKYGIQNKRVTGKRGKQLEQLLSRLDEWIPENVSPSYLHGDLWGGNWLVGKGGQPYVIDPSFLYGDRHFEIAFTELFGGFSHRFYEAYTDLFPLDDDYEDRKRLYQLYYLLVHLNMFGEAYGPDVDVILNHYVG